MSIKKLALAAVIGIMICLFLFGGGLKYLDIDIYQNLFQQSPWLTGGVFFMLFVLGTGLSLPITAILIVASGMIFGMEIGVVISLAAMTLGGTVSLLTGRFVFRDIVERRFPGYIGVINKGIEKEGAFYLLSLRLLPIIPFWIVNLLLGVTGVRIPTFMLTTLFGMIPVVLIYSYAGSQLGSIKELKLGSILTPGMIVALCLLAAFPLLAKMLLKLARRALGKS